MLSSVDARRRWFGTFFLILAVGMLLWGLTFLAAYLLNHPLLFVVYWVTCFLFTGISFAIAIYDMAAVRKRVRQEQREAFERAFREVTEKEAKGSDRP